MLEDLALGEDGDLELEAGDLVLVEGNDAIASSLAARLQFFRGEWFLDTAVGVPYFEVLLRKNPDLAVVREVLRTEALGTTGVGAVDSLELDYLGESRELVVSLVARTDAGELVTQTVEVGL
jgi:hypothetical protein